MFWLGLGLGLFLGGNLGVIMISLFKINKN
mgnify:CR=1 FL=1|jgi:hypothetical protein